MRVGEVGAAVLLLHRADGVRASPRLASRSADAHGRRWAEWASCSRQPTPPHVARSADAAVNDACRPRRSPPRGRWFERGSSPVPRSLVAAPRAKRPDRGTVVAFGDHRGMARFASPSRASMKTAGRRGTRAGIGSAASAGRAEAATPTSPQPRRPGGCWGCSGSPSAAGRCWADLEMVRSRPRQSRPA